MKISFSLVPGSGDNVEEIMKRVDNDVSHMSSLPSLSILGQVLKSRLLWTGFRRLYIFQI